MTCRPYLGTLVCDELVVQPAVAVLSWAPGRFLMHHEKEVRDEGYKTVKKSASANSLTVHGLLFDRKSSSRLIG